MNEGRKGKLSSRLRFWDLFYFIFPVFARRRKEWIENGKTCETFFDRELQTKLSPIYKTMNEWSVVSNLCSASASGKWKMKIENCRKSEVLFKSYITSGNSCLTMTSNSKVKDTAIADLKWWFSDIFFLPPPDLKKNIFCQFPFSHLNKKQ